MVRHALAAVLLVLLAGCSTYSTVTVPAGEPTVVSSPPDTSVLEELPKADIDGTRTEPIKVTVHEDTTTRPTVDLSFLEVDRSDPDNQTITTRVERGSTTVEKTFRLPEVGEQTRLFSRGSGLEGTVFGAPISHEEDAITQSINKPWYLDLFERIRLLFAVIFGGALLYVIVRIVPWA